ncbi:NDP-sugar synthase [Desulfoluna sp.]|uniref:nucleotidyltransferase family protein n=1 Tax=Desulfoluna sp. TaxID=2045199 RepID=UPI00262DD3BC|nr:NDP-sugar synthase [Desulfoluna sp.]
MKAIIIATKGVDDAPVLSERLGRGMLPVLDRPLLQHMVESLIRWGVTEVSFVLSHRPEKVEAFFGCGQRWGCPFHYHLTRDPEHPYRALAEALSPPRTTPLLLAHEESLPLLGTLETDTKTPLLLMRGGETHAQWSGWAVLPPEWSAGVSETTDRQGLEELLIQTGGVKHSLSACLLIKDAATLLIATRELLNLGVPHLMHSAREVEEGIWLSRDVGLHPTAEITPPVYINEACRIGKKAVIGPHTVLGKGCVVDEKTRIKHSVVRSLSYIGKNLSIEACLVDKNCLVNTALGSEVLITDAFIIGDMAEKQLRNSLVRLGSRAMALLLLAAFAPLLLPTLVVLTLFRKGPCRSRLQVVALPPPPHETHWKMVSFTTCEEAGPDPISWEARWWHFFLVFLPGLIPVAQGRLRFVGLGLRTPEALRALPPDWKSLYLSGKGGLITEAMLHFGAYPSEDELYAAETVYTVSSGFRYDLKLFVTYIGQLFGIVPRPGKPS